MKGRAAYIAVAALLVASRLPAQRQDSLHASDTTVRASLFVRPLASLLVPGSGQLMAHQDRGAVYLAAEIYLLSRFLQLDHEATREATRFQPLPLNVAGRPYAPDGSVSEFAYSDKVERFRERR